MPGAPRRTVLFLSNAPSGHNHALDATEEGPAGRLLVDGLAAHGFAVRVRPLHGFPLNPLARRGTLFAGFDPLRALAVLLLDRHVDVIVSVGESNVVIILMLAKLLRFRVPIVLREISARGWRWRDRVVDYVLPRVARTFVLTPHQQAWAMANWRLRAQPDMVGFAIDENFFRPQPAPDGGYILAVGDDVGRDYACLVAAARETPHRLVLRTGSGLAIPPDMAGRVTVAGRLSFAALRDLYAAAAIVAVPLAQVDHPSGVTSLYEAMAMGCAVVASDVGSTRHIVEDGVNGVLVPVGDPVAMGAALTALMADPARRRRLGAAARATIEGAFSYAAYVDCFAAGLRAAVGDATVHLP